MPELVSPDDSDDEGDAPEELAEVAKNMTAAERTKKAHRARQLVGEFECSRAVRELESKGMGDLTDPFVCQQLAKKHPKRRDEDELPLRLSDLAGGQGFERLEVKLGGGQASAIAAAGGAQAADIPVDVDEAERPGASVDA